jgi:spore coat protein U-like protein
MIALLALALGGASPARPICEVEDAALAFGVLDASQRTVGQGNVTVRCSGTGVAQDVTLTVTLASDPATAAMPFGYALFVDPAHRLPWGDAATGQTLRGTLHVPANGSVSLILPIYGVALPRGTQQGRYLARPVIVLGY